MYRTTTLALMLSLGLAATVQAKAQKEAVRMDATTPVSEQIRRVETAMGSGTTARSAWKTRAACSRR